MESRAPICPRCSTNPRVPTGYVKRRWAGYCRSCKAELDRERYIKLGKDEYYTWANHIHRKYGLSEEDYEKLLIKQNYSCAICKSESFYRRLDVDHDHTTGKVRGLLCNSCNVGLGKLRDDLQILRAAVSYLEDN